MGKLIRSFLGHVVPGIIRPLHVLWNEVLGFLFLVLAAWSIPAAIRSFRQFDGDAAGLLRIVLSVAFIAVMGYLGLSSFLRARKIARS